ncbi:hypothetical protein CFB43_23970 [Burkholderia sp. AU15512]|nr:hypothetical protein CFB43_23970 [Burkholderia sp. AU15512]
MRPARTVDDEVETVDALVLEGLVQRAGKRSNAHTATRFACGFTRGPARSYTRRQFAARAVAFNPFSSFQRANDRASRTFVARRQEAP